MDRPADISISDAAKLHGLHRSVISAFLVAEGIPTHPHPLNKRAKMIGPAGQRKLCRAVARLKANRDSAVSTA